MSSFPGSPKLTKGGIVLVYAGNVNNIRVLPFQYNPDTMTRSLQARGAGEDGGDRSEALRLTGPPVETYSVEIQLDASDGLGTGSKPETEIGIQHRLAALEMLLYPESATLKAQNALAASGILEIAPTEAPLTLFVWNKNRIIPIRITEFNITEEAYDEELNPIRAKISLGMRVLSVNDARNTIENDKIR
ncbi:MAG: hypothetical protein ACOYPR_09660, partial [Saprospiraceae bacterium]